MNYQIEFEEAIAFSKLNAGEAGWDIFTPIDFNLMPGEVKLINTGVRVALPPSTVAILKGRSGLARVGIDPLEFYDPEDEQVLGGVIDCTYRGSWGVILKNLHNQVKEFKRGERIAQWVHLPIVNDNDLILKELDQTVRGELGFGQFTETSGGVLVKND